MGRRLQMVRILILACVVGGLFPFSASARQAPRVGHGVGEFFPDVELPTIDGQETIRLSNYRGRRLLLIEFASW